MTDLPLPQLADTVRATQGAYHKLTIIAGPSGEGKTRLLSQLAAELQLPLHRKFQVLKQVISVVKSSFATLWPRILELLPSGYNAAAVAELFRHLDLSQLQQPFDLLASLGH